MPLSIAQQIQEGIAHHSAGRYGEAEAVYRRILEQDANCAGALHLLGVAYAQQKRFDDAIPLLRQAVTLSPNEAAFHANLAQAYLESGSPERALLSAQRSVQLDPNDPAALNHLGNALRLLNRFDEAIGVLQSAVRLREGFAEALQNLALALRESGRPQEALQCLERAAGANPGDARNYFHVGGTLQAQRLYPQAIAAFEKGIAAGCEMMQSYANIGAIHQDMGNYEQAVEYARKAIATNAAESGPYNNLGLALNALGRPDEAIEALDRALALRVDNAQAWNNLGNAHLELLATDRALECYEKALYFQPDHVDAHWNRSLIWLLTGEWGKGWLEYEWRWQRFRDEKRTFAVPQWNGFDIAGKSILLHAEQGLGDTMQFVRYAKRVAARGATVHLECQRSLVSLLKTVEGISSVTPKGEPLPAFDVHCPLLSLPYAMGMNGADLIPADVPYIRADAQLAEQWSATLGKRDRKRVGLAWAGAKIHRGDRARSLSLETLARLFEIKEIQFVSLQKQVLADDGPMIRRLPLIDHSGALRDFADTAALIANLDLVITVDTSVAHLAGAMGKPVWILLPFKPDWRWLLGRDDSPWYPTARLIRQRSRNDWDGSIQRVLNDLAAGSPARE